MLGNYFKTALKNLLRFKSYTFVNIFGLAIGLASSLAVMLWVIDEINYDKFHENADSIYLCYRQVVWNNEVRYDEVLSAPVGPTLKERTPGILDFARTRTEYAKLQYNTRTVNNLGLFVDPSFLNMFTFPLTKGDVQTALSVPNSIVLAEQTAITLFGDQDPIGKTLSNGLVVTGVAADVPVHSSIEFEFLIPFAYGEQTGQIDSDEWWSFGYKTYFQINNNSNVGQIGVLIKKLFKEVDSEANLRLHLQPFTDMHLKGLGGGGRIIYVYMFSVIAVLLLVIACINFVNLATSRANKRAKEIGLRKISGATRGQLISQILFESFLQTFGAVLLAVCILELALPYLLDMMGKQLALEFSFNIVLALLGVAILTAVAAGFYPALVLSSFQPATTLKRTNTGNGHGSMDFVRKALVVFQFTISTGLIFGALVISDQLDYVNNKELGVDKDNIICIRTDNLDKDYESFKNELKQHPGVLNVACAFDPPAWCGWGVVGFDYEGKPEDEDVRAGVAWIDHDYVDLFGLEIVEGRNFSRDFPSDEKEAYIINEAAVRAMNMDSPIGMTIDCGDDRPGKIIGVVKDFHFSSLYNDISPLIIGFEKGYFGFLFVKVADENISGSLEFVKSKWNQFRAGEDFNYRFFDEYLGCEYQIERRTSGLVLGFTVIAVLVACLGLFGLTAYSAERRTKEIGIRKVLGSSVNGIIRLLSKEFLILVIIGNFAAIPIAYYITYRWLSNFAYHVDLGIGVFIIASSLAMFIAFTTVCYHSIKSAIANPIDSLKCE